MRTFEYADWARSAPDLTSKLEAAAFDPHAWPDALNAICDVFRCTLFALRTIGGNIPPSFQVSDRGQSVTDAYIRGEWWNRDPRADAFATAPLMTVVEDADLVGHAVMTHSDFYRDFAFSHDITHLAGWRFHCEDADLAFACNRPVAAGPINADERRALNDLMSHTVTTAVLARKISGAREQSVFETLVNAKAAACLVGADGRILHITPDLESLLGKSAWKQGAPLSLEKVKPAGAFEALLRALKSPQDDIARLRAFVTTAPSGLRLIALPLILRGVGADALGGARGLIIFRSIDAVVKVDPVVLMEMYGLTSSEASVAIMISQGRTVAEAAAARGVTVDTIRAMLKSAFQKTKTRGQSELVALLLRSTIAIAH